MRIESPIGDVRYLISLQLGISLMRIESFMMVNCFGFVMAYSENLVNENRKIKEVINFDSSLPTV